MPLVEARPLPARRGFPRPLEIALILSLVLNLCVVGGFAYSKLMARDQIAPLPSYDQRMEMFAHRIGVDPATSPSFLEWRHALLAAMTSLSQQNQPLLEDAWGELIKPQPDTQRLQSIMDQLALHRRAFQVDTTAALIRFVGALTPDQRETFKRTALDRRDPIGRPMRSSIGD